MCMCVMLVKREREEKAVSGTIYHLCKQRNRGKSKLSPSEGSMSIMYCEQTLKNIQERRRTILNALSRGLFSLDVDGNSSCINDLLLLNSHFYYFGDVAGNGCSVLHSHSYCSCRAVAVKNDRLIEACLKLA